MNIYDILETRPSRLTQPITDFLRDHGTTNSYVPGEIVLEEDSPSDAVFIILEGEVEIRKRDSIGNTVVIATAEKGTVFGEMGVFLNVRRSATIAARTNLTVLALSHAKFMEALQHYPDVTFRLLKSLSGRLNHLNERFVAIVNNKIMIMVGTYIIDQLESTALSRGEMTLYMQKLLKKTQLDNLQATNALANYKRLNIISQFNILAPDIITFRVNTTILRSYLASICVQPLA